MRHYPKSFIALSSLGLLCAIPGLISVSGFGDSLHPVLADPMAGLAFIVSAIALIGSGAFPLVIEKLKENEAASNFPHDPPVLKAEHGGRPGNNGQKGDDGAKGQR
jgi:hypothetical protein